MHVENRHFQTVMLMVGGRVGYYSGDVRQLSDDMRVLKPTFVTAVPRLLNRVYDRVMGEISKSWVKRRLFDMAMHSKMKEVRG